MAGVDRVADVSEWQARREVALLPAVSRELRADLEGVLERLRREAPAREPSRRTKYIAESLPAPCRRIALKSAGVRPSPAELLRATLVECWRSVLLEDPWRHLEARAARRLVESLRRASTHAVAAVAGSVDADRATLLLDQWRRVRFVERPLQCHDERGDAVGVELRACVAL